MTTDIHAAAGELLKKIDAPTGTVNTLAFRDRRGAFIRVLVDPSYVRRLRTLPKTFKGFRVVLENRQPTIAGGSMRGRLSHAA